MGNNTEPGFAPRSSGALLGLMLALLLGACDARDEVGGLWQVQGPQPQKVALEALEPGFSGLVAISSDQYGQDVAGTLFLFTDSYSKIDAWAHCPCAYMEKSEFSSGRLTFTASLCSGTVVTGEFELLLEEEAEFLQGRLVGPDGTSSNLTLVRTGDAGVVRDEEWDRGCQLP